MQKRANAVVVKITRAMSRVERVRIYQIIHVINFTLLLTASAVDHEWNNDQLRFLLFLFFYFLSFLCPEQWYFPFENLILSLLIEEQLIFPSKTV